MSFGPPFVGNFTRYLHTAPSMKLEMLVFGAKVYGYPFVSAVAIKFDPQYKSFGHDQSAKSVSFPASSEHISVLEVESAGEVVQKPWV